MLDKDILFSLFTERLPTVLPNYEERREQMAMALLVSDSLANQKNLIIEAGTGVGKSLAYLIPLLFHHKKENKRVVVSTYTKILQEQLILQDIPIVQRLMPTLACAAYGQENYICKRRSENNLRYGLFDPEEEKYLKDKIIFWAKEKKGLVVCFPENIDPSLLSKINRDGESCLGKRCAYYSECFYYQARREWEAADLLVINHFLFFAHWAQNCKLLPEFDLILFDEAHRLEDAAVGYLGIDLSDSHLKRQLLSLFNPRTKKGLLKLLPISFSKKEALSNLVVELLRKVDTFFFEIGEKTDAKKRIRAPISTTIDLGYELERFNSQLLDLFKNCRAEEPLSSELLAVTRSLQKRKEAIQEFISLRDKESVYWIEKEERGIYLKSAPISVKKFLSEIFHKFKPVILTSATLSVGRDFTFITNRLGIMPAASWEKKILDSPFNYRERCLLFIEERLPFPEEDDFVPQSAKVINEIIRVAGGRTLILFTSFKMMDEVFRLCERGRYRLLKQGDAPVYQLLREFREDTSSCLFATASFWQGVDVPGETLSCLVITRLPFDVPDEPRIEGIVEDLKSKGEEPFWSFQLPQAVLRFRQGFGRLIRNKTDRGVVAVLDKRIIKKNYGGLFLKSLPENIPITFDINPVVGFFKRMVK